jgi:hypothetical protein
VPRDLADMTSPRFLRLVDPGDPAVVHIGYAIREAQDSLIVRPFVGHRRCCAGARECSGRSHGRAPATKTIMILRNILHAYIR